jgi:Barstar (barnase inhibitor)
VTTAKVSLDCKEISDWNSFHEGFARVFGFPDFYGKNMDAWIDCLTSLDAPADVISGVHCETGTVLTLELENGHRFFSQLSRFAACLMPNLGCRHGGPPKSASHPAASNPGVTEAATTDICRLFHVEGKAYTPPGLALYWPRIDRSSE